MNFRELGLVPAILTALKELGYEEPTPIQRGAIPPALAGRDVLGIAQTGTGKTCAFAAPILQRLAQDRRQGPRAIRALILTPTRELALQIQESFEHYGKDMPLRSAVIFGGVGQAPQVEKIRRGLDILVATPGRLLDLQGQGLLDLSGVEIFVLDEADRMLDMGFIHDVRRVLKLLPQKKQTLFFSATMPPEVTELVNQLLHDPARVAVTPVSSPVEAIRQSLYYVDRKNKTKLLAYLVERPEVKNALVFSRTKHGANKIAQDLQKAGISAAAIHGNKSQTARQQALSDFKAGRVKVLAATDIAARGIDIEDLSHVFNYNLPDVPETYVHRIGRTGRAGREGTAVTFCEFGEKDDLKAVEKLLGKPIPVVEDHPWPMEVFEAPQRDKHGKIINPDDQEAREAARERKAQRQAAAKAEAQAAPKAPKKPAQEAPKSVQLPKKAAQPAPKAPEKKPARGVRRQDLDWFKPKTEAPEAPKTARDAAFEAWMAEERAIQAGQAAKRRDPLEGDAVMDATARLLAPKRSGRRAAPKPSPRGKVAPKGPDEGSLPRSDQGGSGHSRSPHQSASPTASPRGSQRVEGTRKPSPRGKVAPKGSDEGSLSRSDQGGSGHSRSPHQSASPTASPRGSLKAAAAHERGSQKAGAAHERGSQRSEGTHASSLEDRKAKIRAQAKARRSRGPIPTTLRPSTQKDSTEQASLMKPYYMNDDD